MLPRDVKTSEVTVCDSPDSSNALHSQTQSPIITDTPISRPVSTQIFLSSPDHRLPPRAASDTRHMNTELNYVGRSNDRDVCYPENNSTVARQPLVDEEHQLIAQYSRELRQQSEPQLVSESTQNLITYGSSVYMLCILRGISSLEMNIHVLDSHENCLEEF
ncbi:hypothetical protein EG68_12573 [Paragonimus skrjabini miyazakii]|uniref:Uncharacterized protein n=1 Tax=Paragonimus skrjabini miyazakii TaxID=59628 RepID=A0A8S9YJ57_9TREM|nr:hypothetical protein EG68_12573 [Paragonimus skrjabini miyazakii]